jgi:RNA-directed DNA polymerase
VEIDHIIEKADGGTDKKKNLQVIHKTCHDQKTAWARKARANKKHIRK